MTAFKKFDPHAFLEGQELAPDSPATLAALASLAAPPLENEIRDIGFTGVINGWDERGKNQIETPSPAKVAKVAKPQPCASAPHPYQVVFEALERGCPDFVSDHHWKEAIESARQFLAAWGDQPHALGWTAHELFGLHPVPAKPNASFDRLSRYDLTGLIWLLHGRIVVKMTADSAIIRTASGGTLMYSKNNKPALGPFGDSLDDMGYL